MSLRKNRGALGLLAATLALGVGVASCAVYPPVRDTTQPNKLKKAALICASADDEWSECRRGVPAEWYFRQTVIDAPFEAAWTFIGEQGETYKIAWEVTENFLIAYRTYETVKGGAGVRLHEPGFRGEPVAAWRITSHFDVWHQYNAATGEELPILYEAHERPWYEREYIRVDWSRSEVAGFGNFLYSKLLNLLFDDFAVEPAAYAVEDPKDPHYFQLSDQYLDIVTAEIHTPKIHLQRDQFGNPVSARWPFMFGENPIARVLYRNSFMRAEKRDYQALYYPDASFEKFGYFRTEREFYDRTRGLVDFKDYLINRINIWESVHSGVECTQHSQCAEAEGGLGAEAGVNCNLHNAGPDGKGVCTKPYAKRGVKPIVFYLSPDFPEEYVGESCMAVQGWNYAYKATVAELLGKPYTPPGPADGLFPETCNLADFRLAGDGEEFDPALHDVFVLKQNEKTCDEFGNRGVHEEGKGRWCYRIGDLRYHMLAWVSQPSAGSPLGYGPSAKDPLTGEIIQTNSFMYGGAVDSYRSYIGDVFDLVSGNLTEDQVRMGENVREYYENLSGNSFPPTIPQRGFRVASLQSLDSMRAEFGQLRDRMEEMKKMSPEARTPNRFKLRGSWVERMLFDHAEWKVANGLPPEHPLTDSDLDYLSPFSPRFHQRLAHGRDIELLQTSGHCQYHVNEFTDASVSWLVQYLVEEKGFGPDRREEAIDWIIKQVYRGVTEHEIGHNVGLRHNFEGSFDADNFFPEYYTLRNDPALQDPEPIEFSERGELPLLPTEHRRYDEALRAKRLERDRQGIKFYQYSTVMDYGGQFYSNFRGLGPYDYAALKFGYGERIEHFDGPPNETRSNRVNKSYYLGGEQCQTNADCPFSGEGQTCLPPRQHSTRRSCSSWASDATLNVANFPIIRYRFCGDERATDRPFCNRWDEGASSVEIVDNLIDSYDRMYVFNNFRRYRRFFGGDYFSRIWQRFYQPMGKQYASLLYQLYYNQDAILSSGAGSFTDMLAGAVKAMNFYERVLATPDVGAYRKAPLEVKEDGTQRWIYQRFNSECTAPGSDVLRACLGTGKHFYSVWETGYYGQLERQARMGIFLDKIMAMLALTNRDWGNPQANDETFPLSFYDGFQPEMLSLFTGLISNDVRAYAPAVKLDANNQPAIEYRDRWTGRFFGAHATNFDFGAEQVVDYPFEPDDDPRYLDVDLIEPDRGSAFFRFYALVFSLQSWPSVYDQTYADYLQLYTFGGPQVRNPGDGRETVSYESPLRKKTYMAVQTPDQKSIIYPLVLEAAAKKALYDYYHGMTPAEAVANEVYAHNADLCRFDRTRDDEGCRQYLVERYENELKNHESFLNLTEEILRLVGTLGRLF